MAEDTLTPVQDEAYAPPSNPLVDRLHQWLNGDVSRIIGPGESFPSATPAANGYATSGAPPPPPPPKPLMPTSGDSGASVDLNSISNTSARPAQTSQPSVDLNSVTNQRPIVPEVPTEFMGQEAALKEKQKLGEAQMRELESDKGGLMSMTPEYIKAKQDAMDWYEKNGRPGAGESLLRKVPIVGGIYGLMREAERTHGAVQHMRAIKEAELKQQAAEGQKRRELYENIGKSYDSEVVKKSVQEAAQGKKMENQYQSDRVSQRDQQFNTREDRMTRQEQERNDAARRKEESAAAQRTFSNALASRREDSEEDYRKFQMEKAARPDNSKTPEEREAEKEYDFAHQDLTAAQKAAERDFNTQSIGADAKDLASMKYQIDQKHGIPAKTAALSQKLNAYRAAGKSKAPAGGASTNTTKREDLGVQINTKTGKKMHLYREGGKTYAEPVQ